ncbi:MAG: Biphenyl dioxygenase ferredoxin subunit [Gammaproteobacteria bacterium]|nr:Biphenyl dioxygenase ferredoxin subunit [Gammaproteobacteria bacterium]
MSDWLDVAPEDQFPVGEYRIVDVDDTEVAVFNVDGEFLAVEDMCTHDGGKLACGDRQGDVIECPRHGARFSLRTGEVLAPPAYEPVVVFPVRIENGMVQVKDKRRG